MAYNLLKKQLNKCLSCLNSSFLQKSHRLNKKKVILLSFNLNINGNWDNERQFHIVLTETEITGT